MHTERFTIGGEGNSRKKGNVVNLVERGGNDEGKKNKEHTERSLRAQVTNRLLRAGHGETFYRQKKRKKHSEGEGEESLH